MHEENDNKRTKLVPARDTPHRFSHRHFIYFCLGWFCCAQDRSPGMAPRGVSCGKKNFWAGDTQNTNDGNRLGASLGVAYIDCISRRQTVRTCRGPSPDMHMAWYTSFTTVSLQVWGAATLFWVLVKPIHTETNK